MYFTENYWIYRPFLRPLKWRDSLAGLYCTPGLLPYISVRTVVFSGLCDRS